MESNFDWILQNPGLNHVTIKIFGDLDINSLFSCLDVSEQWCKFIKENRSLWEPHVLHGFPLHYACISGHVNVVKLLFELGIDVNAIDGEDDTPLILACTHNRLKIVKLLCQHPNIDINATNTNGESPLILACINNHVNMVRFLTQNPNIDINAITRSINKACKSSYMEIFKILLNHPNLDINATENGWMTHLHFACISGNVKAVELLCQHRYIFVNAQDMDGHTPLIKVCFQKPSNDENAIDFNERLIKILKILFKHPIDVNVKDSKGNTALHYACEGGTLDVVKFLLVLPSINVNMLNSTGESPMDIARTRGHQSIVDFLNKGPA